MAAEVAAFLALIRNDRADVGKAVPVRCARVSAARAMGMTDVC
jgi:hypothetical protein